jgi:hypothetical protein
MTCWLSVEFYMGPEGKECTGLELKFEVLNKGDCEGKCFTGCDAVYSARFYHHLTILRIVRR